MLIKHSALLHVCFAESADLAESEAYCLILHACYALSSNTLLQYCCCIPAISETVLYLRCAYFDALCSQCTDASRGGVKWPAVQ